MTEPFHPWLTRHALALAVWCLVLSLAVFAAPIMAFQYAAQAARGK